MWLLFAVGPIFISTFVVGSLVWIRGARSRVNLSFVVFSYVATFWMVANFLGANFKSSFFSPVASQLDFITGCLSVLAVWYFSAALLQEADTSHRYRAEYGRMGRSIATLLALTAVIATFFPSAISIRKPPGHDLTVMYGKLYWVYASLLLLIVAGIAANTFFAQRLARGQLRQQIRVMLGALLLSVIVVGFVNLALPQLSRSENINLIAGNLSYIGVAFFVIGTSYSIARHRLFDINFFVVRAAAYLTSLFAITLVCIVPIVWLFGYVEQSHFRAGEFAAIVLLSGIVLAVLQVARRRFDRLTTRIFFRKYYDLQDVLGRLSDVLVHTADIELIREQTAEILSSALKADRLHYILYADTGAKGVNFAKKVDAYAVSHQLMIVDIDELKPADKSVTGAFRDEGISMAVKLRTTHENLGYMLLGYKQSGEAYTERDRRLLSVAADEIAISLQNALRFEEIQNFNIKLQKEVDEKTRELRRKNQRLIELDETKDDFISMASHQLRTPLTSVKGYLSMVLEGDAGRLTDTQKKMLGQAFSSSQRMVFLITDLLNVSRLKTGKFVIDATPTDLSQVIQTEIAQLRDAASTKQLDIAYSKPAKFPLLMLDETKTRQVIMNYIDNAIYYTKPGGHIRIELTDKPSTVELRVVDDGIGVPRSEQPHLFTKFYRAVNARRARPDGTGLGLFMAKKVIIAQGGSIIFESKENQGSTFGFVFPKAKLKVPSQLPPAPEGPAKHAVSIRETARS